MQFHSVWSTSLGSCVKSDKLPQVVSSDQHWLRMKTTSLQMKTILMRGVKQKWGYPTFVDHSSSLFEATLDENVPWIKIWSSFTPMEVAQWSIHWKNPALKIMHIMDQILMIKTLCHQNVLMISERKTGCPSLNMFLKLKSHDLSSLMYLL